MKQPNKSVLDKLIEQAEQLTKEEVTLLRHKVQSYTIETASDEKEIISGIPCDDPVDIIIPRLGRTTNEEYILRKKMFELLKTGSPEEKRRIQNILNKIYECKVYSSTEIREIQRQEK